MPNNEDNILGMFLKILSGLAVSIITALLIYIAASIAGMKTDIGVINEKVNTLQKQQANYINYTLKNNDRITRLESR